MVFNLSHRLVRQGQMLDVHTICQRLKYIKRIQTNNVNVVKVNVEQEATVQDLVLHMCGLRGTQNVSAPSWKKSHLEGQEGHRRKIL
jgi:hypothetical protein